MNLTKPILEEKNSDESDDLISESLLSRKRYKSKTRINKRIADVYPIKLLNTEGTIINTAIAGIMQITFG
jgi:hypothetical protein